VSRSCWLSAVEWRARKWLRKQWIHQRTFRGGLEERLVIRREKKIADILTEAELGRHELKIERERERAEFEEWGSGGCDGLFKPKKRPARAKLG